MPRKLRVEFPGAIYHVMSRGDRREDIFRDDVDRQDFLKTLAEACQKTGFQVHAYCLMGNHFHLVVETPEANLVAGMRWLLGTYTKLVLAVRLRRETTLTVGWIAQRLHLGTRKSTAVKLHRWGNTSEKLEPDPVKTMV